MDIFECVQTQVDKIVNEKYKDNEEPPIFTVSLLYEKEETGGKDVDHKIILTIQHCGLAFSKVIFPQTKHRFGYESLEEEMKYMYNKTM
ncbi:hypothetical protein SAMN04487895_101625 [Paenibacillus sophorae]|uniref:Uncharacterized protein n=1 Tax=Paenibacillus sophorae TaxID=1333845 RepID=A0A1H8GS63_9BACL|nr:hypothetical protein [Paenibacillus sophorae]QWU14322.1 hypothetical protein KP014_20665 [Paenibacillus sophorae]SEN46796.1 hypothetical protein SAMN04487895_101625 [Paenibacillus sophorae]